MHQAKRAIEDWGGDKNNITHVVAVTCTGILVPGVEFSVSVVTLLQRSHIHHPHLYVFHSLSFNS